MKVADIIATLKPLGILNGINLYRDEPTPAFHVVSVALGHGDEAIDAINGAGGEAIRVPACSTIYAESIFVSRK